ISPIATSRPLSSVICSPRTVGPRSQARLALRLRLALRPHDVLRLAIRYSTISSTARFFSFLALALRIVLSARAVRPCLPMTLPRSFWATRSSITITRSPSTSVTLTCSGSSTSAFATYSMRSLNNHSHCSCFRQLHSAPLRPGLRGLRDQLLHRIRGLRPLGDPRLGFLAIDGDLRRIRDRVVVSDHFDEPSVTRRAGGGHYPAIGRSFAGPFASESDGHCHVLTPWASETRPGL